MRPWTARVFDAALRPAASFNGATALRPWTVFPAPSLRRPSHQLQWGHGLAAVDGRCCTCRAGRRARASMGPRPCGRGRQFVKGADSAAPVLLQWGHGLAAVDGFAAALIRSACSRFNGATALRPWTVMSGAGGRTRPRCFNGATALRPWTAAPTRGSAPCTPSFNGATALRPWTDLTLIADAAGTPMLQWGHGLAAVDGPAAAPSSPHGPQLQWGHGLAAVDGSNTRNDLDSPGFASMGPRPCGRGRSKRRGHCISHV